MKYKFDPPWVSCGDNNRKFQTVKVMWPSCFAILAGQVDDLKAKLAAQEIELTQKNEDANKLIQIVGTETEKVSKEKEFADGEEKKVAVIKEEVTKKQISCETDLAKAEPALIAAQEALNTLNKVSDGFSVFCNVASTI